MLLDLDLISRNAVYHTLTQVIIPRPVAWVLSEHQNGQYNLAPFSYFSAVCSDPPIMMISVGKKPDGSEKDTYRNIIEREQFIIHIAGSELAESVTKSSAVLDAGVSEIELCDLHTTPVEGFPLPRIIGPKIAMSCRFYEEKQIGSSGQHLLFGQVEKVWLDDGIVSIDENGRIKVNASIVDPLGRLGGNEYTTFGEILDISRPD
ncbi:flavin reductase family protein [Neptunomonas antarctica]|uniref:NADH-FMN oxidoreductase RutF, flavin reductase (DIM6/NTAB) family n=1 Tax=Neptunomonas antarctica TaxID=619304 RepID=A0A1N7LTC3_9GAMM|nr:flavin reductase family protein [Neptunomonas antarctica]SIS77024.1 NADH-FMN oxidoreductase RutF, flavin reductase (DIM6/NTAB) family [Neptunomonas antarctica]